MNNPIQNTLAILLLVGGGWYVSKNYDIHGLQNLKITPRSQQAGDAAALFATPGQLPSTGEILPSAADTTFTSAIAFDAGSAPMTMSPAPEFVRPIHLGTFNLQGFGRQKVDKLTVLDQIARLCRQFDAVALQGIVGPDRDLIPRLVEAINRTGAQFDYLELAGNDRNRLAFVFDAQRLQTDRRQLYRVADPGQELSVDPLVAWFRVRELPANKAWTFSFVNVWIDPERAAEESQVIAPLIRAVQNDGRHEDDVIIGGSFSVETMVLQRLVGGVGYQPAAIGVTSDIQGVTAFDQVLVPNNASQEYTGRAGGVDFLRLMNMTIGEAEEISDRIPVWAEFTPEEAE